MEASRRGVLPGDKEGSLKVGRLLVVAAAAAMVVPVGMAAAQPEFSSANGGGQILNEDQINGAGDTIAFSVKDEDEPKGQVQYVDRELNGNGTGTGQNQTVLHGSPTCFVAMVNMAQIGVLWNDGTTSTLFVEDGGPHADMVTIAPGSTPDCDDDEPDDTTALARGNVTVRDNQ